MTRCHWALERSAEQGGKQQLSLAWQPVTQSGAVEVGSFIRGSALTQALAPAIWVKPVLHLDLSTVMQLILLRKMAANASPDLTSGLYMGEAAI